MIISLLMLVFGFIALIWSADRFVFGSAAIARNFGIPPLVIGLTIVAMGSSAPEIMVAISASLEGKANTAIGNALGSNITNVALVLGVTALLRSLLVQSTLLYRELPILLIVSFSAGYMLFDQQLSQLEGIILLVMFFSVIGGLCYVSVRDQKKSDPLLQEVQDEVPEGVTNGKALLWMVVGMAMLPISSTIMVDGAVYVAKVMGMSDLVIGLTIIAIGTSLPELAACIASVLKNEHDLALGNIIGSNIFNILAVLAVPALMAPGVIDANAAGRDLYIMLGLTLVLFLMAWGFNRQRRIARWEGLLLLLCFIGYQFFLFTHLQG